MPRVNELTPRQRKAAKARRDKARRIDLAHRMPKGADCPIFRKAGQAQAKQPRVDTLTTPRSAGYLAAAAYLNKSI